jgi:hypothetical protein
LGGDVTRTAYVLPRLRSRLRYAAGCVAPCGVRLGLAVRTAYRFFLGAPQGFPVGSPLGFLEDARRVLRVYVYAHTQQIEVRFPFFNTISVGVMFAITIAIAISIRSYSMCEDIFTMHVKA